MKKLLLLSIGILFAQFSFAQSGFILEGTLQDETKKPLLGATIALLSAEDSVLTAFAISKPDGQFSIKPIKVGNYVLNISFVGYSTIKRELSFNESTEKVTQLGIINLEPNQQMLNDIEVAGDRIPVLLDKDTITYDARAFKSRPDDAVEDLLKKLPGIEVERDGSIKAQGESVGKVLVDGKEFFGDNPQMATKNLPADAISKVQVYDKKSEFTEFSGVEDGQEQKTINLELKEDKKNGVFGDVMAGYGTDDRYKLKANVNSFNKSSQLSFIGNQNNINEQGFSFNDYINFMGGLQSMMSGGGGGFQINTGGVPINSGSLADGIMTSTAAGLNLNHDFSAKTKFSGSYLFSRIDNRVASEVDRTNFLQDGSEYLSNQNSLRETESYNHTLNFKLDHKISDRQKLQFKTTASFSDGDFQNEGGSTIFNTDNNLQNEASNRSKTEGNNYSADLSLNYQNKLSESGRTLNITGSTRLGDNTSEGELQTLTNIYGDSPQTIRVQQEQENGNQQNDYGLELGYTEPLGKNKYLKFNASHKNYKNEVEKSFYDLDESNGRIFNADLSTLYDRNYYYNKGGVSFNWNNDKNSFKLGLDYQQSELNGDILDQELTINQSFNRFLPNFRIRHEFSTGKSISLRYNTRLQEPTLEQLQPIVNNTNPLDIYQGNPNLSASYQHIGSLNLVLYDQFSFTSFFAFINATYTEDKIINSRTIDDQLRLITQPVNVDYDFNLTGSWSFSRPIKWIGTKFKVSQRLNYMNSLLYINNTEDEVNRWNQNLRFSVENINKEVIDIAAGLRLTYNQTKYAENDRLNQDFVNKTWFADLTINFGKKLVFTQTFDYQQYSQESFGNQPDVALWRGSLTYLFLKNNRGQLKLSGFDLLNQNTGINRNSSLNFIETERVTALGRFFMLGFTYKLSQFKRDNGIQIKFDQ